MPLYHCEVGFPADLRLPSMGNLRLQYSQHAKNAAADDGWLMVGLPAYVPLHKATPIEVETDSNGKAVKVVYRMAFNKQKDIVLAVKITTRPAIVKTLWFNDVQDKHRTLNVSRYDRP
jgi:hypothetical protein